MLIHLKCVQQLRLLISSTHKLFLIVCVFWYLKILLKYYFHYQSNRCLLLKHLKIQKNRKFKKKFLIFLSGSTFFSTLMYFLPECIQIFMWLPTYIYGCMYILSMCICTVCITCVIHRESPLYYFLICFFQGRNPSIVSPSPSSLGYDSLTSLLP